MSVRIVSPRENAQVLLTGAALTVDEVVTIARDRARVSVCDAALERVVLAREVVEELLAAGHPIYGLNTGLGSLVRVTIPTEELARFAFRTVADQTAGHGRELPGEVVRAMMATRINGMAKAGTGVRRELIERLADMLNAGVHPIVREIGSVGQSDMAEMAEIGKVVIGHGRAELRGLTLSGREALKRAGMAPMELAPKEALGLISSNGVTLGFGSLVLYDAADLVESFQIAAALSMEAYRANLSIVHPEATRLRPHVGLVQAAQRLRDLLDGSDLWQAGSARNLQDPLSFRCAPQTHGALHDQLSFARATMEIELNSSGDNPLVSIEHRSVVSVGNFDVVALAMAFDSLRLGLTQACHVANERVQKLLWNQFSGLPTGLSADATAGSGGLRPLGRACAAIAAEARFLANPVSLDYRGQIAEGIEDHASMAPLAVRRTAELVGLAHRLVAFEMMIAAQAIDLRAQIDGLRPALGAGVGQAFDAVRACIPMLQDDTNWSPDTDELVRLVANGELRSRVARESGERIALSEHVGPALEPEPEPPPSPVSPDPAVLSGDRDDDGG